jgi:hypothetical protein
VLTDATRPSTVSPHPGVHVTTTCTTSGPHRPAPARVDPAGRPVLQPGAAPPTARRSATRR